MTNADLHVVLAGGGNMGRAIVAGLLRAGHPPGLISVVEPLAAARTALLALNRQLGVTAGGAAAARTADVLVLAVKPQVLAGVAKEIGPYLRAGSLVLSIAAGVTLASLREWLDNDVGLVRAMPNQPAMVGGGMTVLSAAPDVTDEHRAEAEYVGSAVGKTAWLADESLMDAVTAVSGSGPAYFYLVMELMEAAARELGLPAEVARLLVRQTAVGAAAVAADPGVDAAAMRASVTSPGGTTAAALRVFDEAGLREIFRRALTAARDRGLELGRNSTRR